MDPYSSSGYKSDRGRDQAKAFKTHVPVLAFVAPGFPVEVTVPAPVYKPGFATPAKPYFDSPTPFLKRAGVVAAGLYAGWELGDWLDYRFNITGYYDDEYTVVGSTEVFPPGGWHHPNYVYCSAAPPGAGSLPNYYGSFTDMCGSDESASLYLNASHPWTDPTPGNGLVRITHTLRDDVFPAIRKTGQGQYDLVVGAPDVSLWVQGVPGAQVSPAAVQFRGVVPAPTAWVDAVAAPNSQPSADEQVAEIELPGKVSYGVWTVPYSLDHPFTVIDVAPGSAPVTVPGVEIDPGSDSDPGSITIIPPTVPPFPDETAGPKEAKVRNPIIHAGHVVINFATELNDLFQALLQGLPRDLRPVGPRGAPVPPWEVLQAIWDHWDRFDAQVALEAFVNNQIEDAIYGRFFGQVSRLQRRAGVTAGLSRGLRGRQPWQLVVPQVHFAHGQYSISFGDYEMEYVPSHP